MSEKFVRLFPTFFAQTCQYVVVIKVHGIFGPYFPILANKIKMEISNIGSCFIMERIIGCHFTTH